MSSPLSRPLVHDIQATKDIRSKGLLSWIRAGHKTKASVKTIIQHLVCFTDLFYFAICRTLTREAWRMETFHIILITSTPLHISRPSTRLGRPTVRLAAVQRQVWTGSTLKASAKKDTCEWWNPGNENSFRSYAERETGKQGQPQGMGEYHKITQWETENKEVCGPVPKKDEALRTLYKESRDWNRSQSGGNVCKSPHFDALDAILGCRDIVTCNRVQQTGMGKADTKA